MTGIHHRQGRSGVITNEEKELLIAYLVDAGDIDPDDDVEAQFPEWYQVRELVLSGETHYKAVLDAARVRKQAFSRGYRLSGIAQWHEGDPKPGDAPVLLALRQEQRVCDHALRVLR